MEYTIHVAADERSIRRCYPVLRQLREHLDESSLVRQVIRQQAQGYYLAYLESEKQIRSVAGYRFCENLSSGKLMYVDDLVTDLEDRSKGFGQILFDWLLGEAERNGCNQLTLDSGVQRFGAHRFYLRKGMDIVSHHFAMRLT
jgi:GNAT superfamily N-acetyltransferase